MFFLAFQRHDTGAWINHREHAAIRGTFFCLMKLSLISLSQMSKKNAAAVRCCEERRLSANATCQKRKHAQIHDSNYT